jgi:hypothetical protein
LNTGKSNQLNPEGSKILEYREVEPTEPGEPKILEYREVEPTEPGGFKDS